MDQIVAPSAAPTTTRLQLLRSARSLFAAHGYAGASIAAISQELGVTKQALLHHFGSKDALYAEAVEQTASEVLALLFDVMEDDSPAEDQLEAFCDQLTMRMARDAAPAKLLLREMLDHALTPKSEGRSFATLLESLVATVQATERWQETGVQGAVAVVSQLFGAAVLVHAANDTLSGLFGPAAEAGARDQSAGIFTGLVSATLRD